MRDYGKVHTSFWTSSTTRSMSEDARTLAFYLLTCPHGTIAGVFRLPNGYVCDDLQWTAERVNVTLSELLGKGFANRCETTKWVWIIKHFEWNKPENPNQLKSAAKIAELVPDECCWKQDYMRLNAFFLGLDYTAELKPLPNGCETLSKPVAVTVAVTGTEVVEEGGVLRIVKDKKNKFKMHEDWEPSDSFESLAKIAGFVFPDDKLPVDELAEFKIYRITHPDRDRTQNEWEHLFIQSLTAKKIYKESRK